MEPDCATMDCDRCTIEIRCILCFWMLSRNAELKRRYVGPLYAARNFAELLLHDAWVYVAGSATAEISLQLKFHAATRRQLVLYFNSTPLWAGYETPQA